MQGLAVRAAEQAPCPMEARVLAQIQSGELDPADLPACCNDLQAWAESGHLCKSDTDCQLPSAWVSIPPAMQATLAGASDLPGALFPPAPAAPPGTPWRPPAAL